MLARGTADDRRGGGGLGREGVGKGREATGRTLLPNGREGPKELRLNGNGGGEVLSVESTAKEGILEGGATFAPRYKEPRRGIKRWKKKKEPGESG